LDKIARYLFKKLQKKELQNNEVLFFVSYTEDFVFLQTIKFLK